MKIAVSSMGTDLDSVVFQRFELSPYFIIIETAKSGYETITNDSDNSVTGSEIAVAQELANRGVDTILTGSFGLKASILVSQVGIEMVAGARGNVKQVLEDYKNDKVSA